MLCWLFAQLKDYNFLLPIFTEAYISNIGLVLSFNFRFRFRFRYSFNFRFSFIRKELSDYPVDVIRMAVSFIYSYVDINL
jgi:hypothetical protein